MKQALGTICNLCIKFKANQLGKVVLKLLNNKSRTSNEDKNN